MIDYIRIEELKGMIKGMKADGEIFGLVGEDIEKIHKWKREIKELNEDGSHKKGCT